MTKKMTLSQLVVRKGMTYKVESKTDALWIVNSIWTKAQYILNHGDVEIIVEDTNDKKTKMVRVPEFDEVREKFNQWKTAECAKWGCE